MSKRKHFRLPATDTKIAEADKANQPNQWFVRWQQASATQRFLALGIIALFSLGALGATVSLSPNSGSGAVSTVKAHGGQPANTVNHTAASLPLAAPPAPTSATPQLSKEYVYAGSRMLAVEDAGATNAPPADLAVWRSADSNWYVLGGNNNVTVQNWGLASDKPAPGDYDGDGKTDFAIFRPSTGDWWILSSSNGTYSTQSFGANGDQLAQADYDGDGKTDLAVFRSGNWFVKRSRDGMLFAPQYGIAGDLAAPADYDGDGLADVGVWRSAENKFYSRNSSNGLTPEAVFGQSSTEPVCGDYDGDGKADYAIRSGANWMIKQSSNNQTVTIGWQQADDKAVPNDYDGDGKVDIAVWRPGNGTWYIRNSHDNSTRSVQWGSSGDIPVPAFYRRYP